MFMRFNAVVLGLLGTAVFSGACSETSSELKAGRDVQSFQKLSDGSYAVVCKDGLVETASEEAILSNQVCQLDKYPYVLKSKQPTFLFSEDGEQDNCILPADQILRFGTRDQPLSVSENHFLVPIAREAVAGCNLNKALVLKSHVQLGRHVGSKLVWDYEAPEVGVAALFSDPEIAIPSASGSVKLGPVGDVIPLSSGWLLAGDSSSNKIVKINAITGAVAEEYQLTVAPSRMVLDETTGILTVATRSANKLVRINLLSKTMETLSLPTAALGLAAAGQGQVFAIGKKDSFDGQILLLNRQGKIVKDWTTDWIPSAVAYDPTGRNLLVVGRGIQRYEFNEETLALIAREQVDAGNIADLVLSPDGSQLAAPAGGGNGNGYTISDFNARDLNERHGEWNVGAYPSGAVFFTKRDLFAAHNRQEVKIFNKTTHALMKNIPMSLEGCSYNETRGMTVSRQENLVYVAASCGFNRDSGAVFWFKVD
jgi:DNA-binding beta-propeller fold protein YncE